MPETLCGFDLAKDLYDPLFPPGSDLIVTDYPDDTLMAIDSCEIGLDGNEIIRSETSGAYSFQDYMDAVGRNYDYDVKDGSPVDGEFEAMVWPGFAIAGTACEPGEMIDWFTVGLRVEHPDDDDESVRVLSELIQPFMQAAVEKSACRPDPQGEYPVTAN